MLAEYIVLRSREDRPLDTDALVSDVTTVAGAVGHLLLAMLRDRFRIPGTSMAIPRSANTEAPAMTAKSKPLICMTVYYMTIHAKPGLLPVHAEMHAALLNDRVLLDLDHCVVLPFIERRIAELRQIGKLALLLARKR